LGEFKNWNFLMSDVILRSYMTCEFCGAQGVMRCVVAQFIGMALARRIRQLQKEFTQVVT
jgi:hypothetical protein